MDTFISFIKSNYILILKSLEVMAALTGLILLKKYKQDKTAKFFIFFLFYVVLIETLGSYTLLIYKNKDFLHIYDTLKNTVFSKNYWWYSLVWAIGSSIFFSIYFFKVLKSKKLKTLVKYLAVPIICIQFFFYVFKFENFHSGNITEIRILNLALVLIVTSIYFIELINSEAITNFYKSLPFYVATAAMMFFLIKTPVVFFEKYFNTSDQDYIALKYFISLFSILFMYLTYTIGLIVSKPEKS